MGHIGADVESGSCSIHASTRYEIASLYQAHSSIRLHPVAAFNAQLGSNRWQSKANIRFLHVHISDCSSRHRE